MTRSTLLLFPLLAACQASPFTVEVRNDTEHYISVEDAVLTSDGEVLALEKINECFQRCGEPGTTCVDGARPGLAIAPGATQVLDYPGKAWRSYPDAAAGECWRFEPVSGALEVRVPYDPEPTTENGLPFEGDGALVHDATAEVSGDLTLPDDTQVLLVVSP